MNKREIYFQFDEHLLNDEKPSSYFNTKELEEVLKSEYPFDMLGKLKDTPQSPKYHPEGSVWNHVMLVLDKAAEVKYKSRDKRTFMWAALLHDIGKGSTTKIRKNGKITSYDHDVIGEDLSIKFLREFEEDEDFIYAVSKLVRWHMQPLFVNKDLPFKDISTMLKQVSLEEIALLSLCDRLGRGELTEEKKKEEEKCISNFVEICKDKYK